MNKNILVLILAISFVLSTVITNLAQKITMDLFNNYGFYAIQFMNTLYVPLGFILLCIVNKGCSKKNQDFPHLLYFFLAWVDSLGVLLTGLTNSETPGETQVFLNQLNIIFSMIISYLILGKKYKWQSLAGGLIILGGIALLSVIGDKQNHKGSKYNSWSCVVYGIGCSLFSLSFVIKELFFRKDVNEIMPWYIRKITCLSKEKKIHTTSPYHLTTWVAVYMVPITFVLYFIKNLITKGINPFSKIGVNKFTSVLDDGAKCMVGINSNVSDTCYGTQVFGNEFSLFTWLMIFSVGTFVAGVIAVLLTEKGSALIQYVSQSLTVPLGAFAYTNKSIMGPFTEEIKSVYSYIGFGILLAGLVLYVFGDPDLLENREEDKKNKSEVTIESPLVTSNNEINYKSLDNTFGEEV
jgi:drug/metabolite transporter (DMT)-like permease